MSVGLFCAGRLLLLRSPSKVPLSSSSPAAVYETFDGHHYSSETERQALMKMNEHLAFLRKRIHYAENDLKSVIASFDVGLRTATDVTNAQKMTDDARTELELSQKGGNSAINVDNKFSNLKVDEACNGDASYTPEPKLPPIMRKPGDNLKTKLADINTEFKGDVKIKLAGEYLKIFPKYIVQHRLITVFLRATNTEFFVITPKNQRPLKAVLKFRKIVILVFDLGYLLEIGCDSGIDQIDGLCEETIDYSHWGSIPDAITRLPSNPELMDTMCAVGAGPFQDHLKQPKTDDISKRRATSTHKL
ncbi:hypothetical protein CEXT_486771 [Caerostris extrusa]|uniref:Uncharacterized protein n=1 Tax=Caerostris extrusa TaxID=172846 RepID=A0AAV4MJZ7_CAEEX|nr:hypothetical protein CEXT_486771 [Caerostris extrusa]